MVNNYGDFLAELKKSGFSQGGGNPRGIYTAIPCSWDEPAPEYTDVRWFSDDPETDPWAWRKRVVDEGEWIMYSKCFFRMAGYITEELFPYFYACRRQGLTFDDIYFEGRISHTAKRVYDLIRQQGRVAYHEIKYLGGFGKADNKAVEKAVTDLQMGMFITVCGHKQKSNRVGISYGWESSVYSTVEDFWGGEPEYIEPKEAEAFITEKVLSLNPDADPKIIRKFIYGK